MAWRHRRDNPRGGDSAKGFVRGHVSGSGCDGRTSVPATVSSVVTTSPLDAAVTPDHANVQQSLKQTLWRPGPVPDWRRLGQIDETTGCRFDLPGGDRVS